MQSFAIRVFKFGGASVKDAEAVRNALSIIQKYPLKGLVVVVSAMGKMTNLLEEILSLVAKKSDYSASLERLQTFHKQIATDLFKNDSHPIVSKLNTIFESLDQELATVQGYDHYDCDYDRIVSFGEILSTTIVQAYWEFRGIPAEWMDARQLIKTDGRHREAKVDWSSTQKEVLDRITLLYDKVIVTQGFIGSSMDGRTTTLGREGSDFSGAILAHCLNAESLTIWKDVPGVLNGDPRKIRATHKYPSLSYVQAAETFYYGAKVVHPKTIRPLAQKNIPLYVRSFEELKNDGTLIQKNNGKPEHPAIIIKEKQCLIHFEITDFTFINEKTISVILHFFDRLNIKINLMQNSALSFSVCMDYHIPKVKALIDSLSHDYEIELETDLSMITIQYYTEEVIESMRSNYQIRLEQRTSNTLHWVVEN